MEREKIQAFLHRVATDPAYRRQLETDPIGTLAGLGIKLESSGVPPGGVHLPSNEEILARLDEIIDQLEETGLCGGMSWPNAFIWSLPKPART
jgi:hypothetical protein